MRRTLFVNSLPNFVNSVLRVRVGFFEFRINKKLKTIDEKNSRFEMLTDYSTKSSQFGVIKQTLKNFGHTKLSIMSLKLLFFVCKLLEKKASIGEKTKSKILQEVLFWKGRLLTNFFKKIWLSCKLYKFKTKESWTLKPSLKESPL